MRDRWTLTQNAEGEFILRLKSGGNNKVLVSSGSQLYTRSEDAMRAYKTTRWAALRAFFRPLVIEKDA